ncbi:TIR domain-containing protein [Actinomadura xylanilytica]|uniref:TIR domain-containing protein n=1 Tax=Actinomadura xylanilytica TaxID=887459 RepID=UPI00255AB782|nr:TIR domain-containing protein [Actinomadura xylanilytica]MDL4772495.1 TIR domain-containing protein [Actinomadura xylanilytica]
MGSIFISYRSADDAYAAALLDQMLSQMFGRNNVFRASRSIVPGSDYESALLAGVESSRVMLVIVGKSWREGVEATGGKLFGSDDWVRKEIAKALEVGVVIIPILISGAPRLAELQLPQDVRKFSSFQYMRFDYRNVENDFLRIGQEVAHYVSGAEDLQSNAIASALRELADKVEALND